MDRPLDLPLDLDDDACYRAIATRDRRFDGRLFVAVTSTRIYCRPFCPAPTPQRANCRFFRTAAAAQEAGFRPCLRCRPETSPELAFWRGSSNTVSRALALIEAGGLDDATVEGLASRLGIGERQLRRLFAQHLGAAPITVAQTRRILLAKQLIQDTRLPMTEVAAAAGFGSLRRFNETFQGLYRKPPRALRRAGIVAESVRAAGGGLTVKLGYKPPYDWDGMLAFLGARAIPGIEAVADGRYARTIAIGAARGVLVVEPAAGDCLRVMVRFPALSALSAIIARVRRVFDLAADPVAIGGDLRQDPVLAPLVAARPGLRVPGAWDGFELGVRAILGQQITVSAATALAGELVARHGDRLVDPIAEATGLTHVFPTPQQLARADFATLGMPQSRRAALAALVAAVRADPRLFGPRASLEDAIAALRGLAGIGEWTAQYIAMRELREPDAFPAADVGLMRALARRQGTPASPAALLARAERWRPWRAYAALHLWASEAEPATTPTPMTDRCAMSKTLPDKQPGRLRLDRLPTPIGEALIVTDEAGFLRAFDWADCEAGMMRLLRLHYGTLTPQPGRAPADLMRRLRHYFEGDLGALAGIAWRTGGTPFQRKVWQALTKIRPGETLNYGGLAATLGCASAVRAVGTANGANPISVVVPCHRVIGADGSLTGYGGGIARKRWLLRHEGAAFRDTPVKDIRKRAA